MVLLYIAYSGDIGFLVTFGEISYLVTDKKNRNDQELGLILPGNFIENAVIDKKVSLKKIIHQK
ncbi:MAG: hypothetical protein RLZZ417_989 [Bacteroidota bacterium]